MSLADYKGAFAIRSFCADFQKLSLDLPKRHSGDFVCDFVRKLASNKPLLEHMAINYPSSLQDAIDRAIFFDSLVNSNPTVTDALKSLGRPRAGVGVRYTHRAPVGLLYSCCGTSPLPALRLAPTRDPVTVPFRPNGTQKERPGIHVPGCS